VFQDQENNVVVYPVTTLAVETTCS